MYTHTGESVKKNTKAGPGGEIMHLSEIHENTQQR
jgi:hypothetical protein